MLTPRTLAGNVHPAPPAAPPQIAPYLWWRLHDEYEEPP
jgi:hypothetical protein